MYGLWRTLCSASGSRGMHEVSPGGIGMPCPVRYGAEMRMEDGSGLSTHALTQHRDNYNSIFSCI